MRTYQLITLEKGHVINSVRIPEKLVRYIKRWLNKFGKREELAK